MIEMKVIDVETCTLKEILEISQKYTLYFMRTGSIRKKFWHECYKKNTKSDIFEKIPSDNGKTVIESEAKVCQLNDFLTRILDQVRGAGTIVYFVDTKIIENEKEEEKENEDGEIINPEDNGDTTTTEEMEIGYAE